MSPNSILWIELEDMENQSHTSPDPMGVPLKRLRMGMTEAEDKTQRSNLKWPLFL